MLCAISGETPQDPVISSKSGNVFERRLIESYISENGKDPITNDALTVADLVPVTTSRVVPPRPPTLTSIPALLSAFQNEWDAFALDAFTLRQQLGQTRQELATALYQHDAAVRVVARLTRERDEARDALSKVSVGAAAGAGDAMQIDSPAAGLPEALADKVDATQAALSKSRRKRAVPAGWATPEAVETYGVTQASAPIYPGSSFVAVDSAGELALVGGADGLAGVFSVAENKLVQPLVVGGGAVTDGVFAGAQTVVASANGAVKVFEGAQEVVAFTSHAGAANALALHPTGDILASVGVDKSFVFYDLEGLKAVAQVYTEHELTACAFHPDGHLFAAASRGLVSLYHVKTLAFAASFPLASAEPVTALTFSENGIWFAAAAGSSAAVFDLRKEGGAAVLKTFDGAAAVSDVCWDYSGQFLALVGGGGVEVWSYRKKEKRWEGSLKAAVPGRGVAWGKGAERLVVVGEDGVVSVLGAKE